VACVTVYSDLYGVDGSWFKKTVSGITSDVICHQLKYIGRLFLMLSGTFQVYSKIL
jgi:hypothetical protein